MRLRALVALWLIFAVPYADAAATVGSGAPDNSITLAFVFAWGRGNFNRLVADPTDNVTKFGASGLIQHFPSTANSAVTLALVKPDSTDASNVMQVLAPMYAYYATQAVATVGYPTDDTLSCPALKSAGNTVDTCQWQPFSNNYALFAYAQPVYTGGQNFATRDPFLTKWSTFGGVIGLGPATSAEATVISKYGPQATFQSYDQGAIYNITSGVLTGRLLAVKEPVYDLYLAQGAQSGSMGLPVTEELKLASGLVQQTFEGGAIRYDPATGIAVLLPPVASIVLNPVGPLHLNGGETATVQATLFAADSNTLTDRTVTWNTSNGQVVQITANGLSATLKAVGSGTASITASSGGKTSAALIVTVSGVCCQIGEGAPTAAIQQAFQSAVTRNKLSVQLPAASPVTRVGNGYVQQLSGAGGASYLVAVVDGSLTGYVVSGNILVGYAQLMGGPSGSLGYPTSDATTLGRQNFQNGALAGNPVLLVSGTILAKWAALGYETGILGLPSSDYFTFQTFSGTSGKMQSFHNAWIVNPTTGRLAGQAFAVSGTIFAAYAGRGGISGNMGAPIDDEHAAGAVRQQDFEGGSISYAAGSDATVTIAPRQPSISATPASVIPGLPVHLVVGGFQSGATLRVSMTGRPDFLVTVASGAYAWDTPAPSQTGVVTLKAVDAATGASAQATFTVAAAALSVTILSGDQQTGAPGAQLASPLVVVVRDQSGDPVPNQMVTFAASPGGFVLPASVVTGADGKATASWRLPPSEGTALATASAGKSVVTFSAKSQAFSLTNFPALSQNVDGTLGNGPDLIRDKGALLTAAASILRYHQSRGDLPQPNGLADVAGLNQFLKSFCVGPVCDGFVTFGSSTEQTVNLWRLGAFVGGSVDVRVENVNTAIQDLVAAGSPVLVALALYTPTSTFVPAIIYGSHFVVATGISPTGQVIISDPVMGFTTLQQYFLGFQKGDAPVLATISTVIRLLPLPPVSPGFLVASDATPLISSVAGNCGRSALFIRSAAVLPNVSRIDPNGAYFFQQCDGSRDSYQIYIQSNGAFSGTFTDLSGNAARATLDSPVPVFFEATRNGSQWNIGPVSASISTNGVVNPANQSSQVAPGGFVSIYGTGLAGTSSVQMNGEDAHIVAALPFLVNAVVPLDAAPGSATVTVTSPSGAAQQTITISPVAPAIFTIGNGQAAITNQDNSLNTASNPESRGRAIVIYATGFGAVSTSGGLSRSVVPVSAVIGGVEVRADFAGLTPGVPGLYQANIVLPSTLPPGLALPLYLTQGGTVSNAVTVSVQ